jgi:hypothetical protein
MDEPQHIDVQKEKFGCDLTGQLEQMIRESQVDTFAVFGEFFSLFPSFLWEWRGILWKAELIRPTYRITQMNKPTEGNNDEAG